MELAIDTSTKYASLGLSLNGKMVAENQWLSGWNHTVEIGSKIRKLLKSYDGNKRTRKQGKEEVTVASAPRAVGIKENREGWPGTTKLLPWPDEGGHRRGAQKTDLLERFPGRHDRSYGPL